MRSQEEYVLRTVEERGIRFVQLWFTDVLGTPKTFSITPAELENALDEGMTFDGSAIDGFSRVQESDVLARPDANTFQLLPWHGHGHVGLNGDGPEAQVARVFCDVGPSTGPTTSGSPSTPPRRSSSSTSPTVTRPSPRSPWTRARTSS
jgi:glutamine synthetase